MLVPTRVPPGKHTVAVRMNRSISVGGPAEFLYSVEIENPEYGKAIEDPAYLNLKRMHPAEDVRIVSLRRAAHADEAGAAFPEERVLAAKVWDNTMKSPNGHWNAGIDNFGTQPTEEVGQWPGFKAAARNLLKWDLGGLPKDAEILGARIRLTLIHNGHGTAAGAKLECYGVRRAWNEGREGDGYSCWYGPRYIHNRSGGAGVKWDKVGCDDPETDRLPEPESSLDLGGFPRKLDPDSKDKNAPREKTRLISFDVTGLVKKWHAGEFENNGVVLAYRGEGGTQFCSSEFQDFPYRPTLVVAYKGAAAKPSYALPPEEDLERAQKLSKTSGKPLLVTFSSPTCGVCLKVANTTMTNRGVLKLLGDAFHVVNLNIEAHAQLAQDFGVATVPAAVVLHPTTHEKKGLLESETLVDADAFIGALRHLAAQGK